MCNFHPHLGSYTSQQLFRERYEALLVWALRLTNQNHEAAQDLVQDAFVQFMLGRTGVEQIESI